VARSARVRLLVIATGRYHYPHTEIRSNESALAFIPVHQRSPLPRGTFELSAGYRREVVVLLTVPLGNRVVVDLDATPVAVVAQWS